MTAVAGGDRRSPPSRDLVLVEGAGGLLVRFDAERLDARRPGRRGSARRSWSSSTAGLGTLNHTALTRGGLAPGACRLRRASSSAPGRPPTAGPGRAQQRRDLRGPSRRAARWARCRPAWAALDPPRSWPRRRPGWAPTLGGAFDAADFRRARRTRAAGRSRRDGRPATRPRPGARARASGSTRRRCSPCSRLPDDRLPAPRSRSPTRCGLRWCGPEVEVEGIVSVKTGGCPEDCHFCSQSGLFSSPVRAAWLDIPSLVAAAVRDRRDRRDGVLHRRRRPRARTRG